jgi:2-polyprenyl-3-methyl-5-hydroxy-6-metoxy-1,4-benzoquinol methylase
MPKTIYDPYEGDQFGNMDANLRFLAAANVVRPGIRVLEIGSGRGALLQELRSRGVNVTGIEPAAALAADARRLHGALPLARMSGTALGFADAAFDLVISFDVFEHIADSDTHLTEVRRVLRPGGAYALQTPNKWTNSVFETIRWRSFTAWQADHCALHSLAELRRRFTAHRFAFTVYDVPVVNDYYRAKLRRYTGAVGSALLTVINPDRLPQPLRTNLFVVGRKGS